MNPILAYFGIKDLRQIRDSKRFKEEIEPQFFGDVILSARADYLEVIGFHLHERAGGKVPSYGIYDFACSGGYRGRFVRSAITF
jgi:hypothetical protein